MIPQTLVITDWLPAPILNAGHGHWAGKARQADTEKKMAWASAKQANWETVCPLKARLTITLVFPVQRKRDRDNLYARVKHVIDGLKPWIVDDSEDWLDLVVRSRVERGRRAVEITLEAVG